MMSHFPNQKINRFDQYTDMTNDLYLLNLGLELLLSLSKIPATGLNDKSMKMASITPPCDDFSDPISTSTGLIKTRIAPKEPENFLPGWFCGFLKILYLKLFTFWLVLTSSTSSPAATLHFRMPAALLALPKHASCKDGMNWKAEEELEYILLCHIGFSFLETIGPKGPIRAETMKLLYLVVGESS